MTRPIASRLMVPAAFWLGLLAAVLALWLSGQASSAWQEVRGARLLPLLLVLVPGVLLPIIHALRWRVVMRALGVEVPARLAADVTVSASLVNYASPGYLGAPAKAYLANRAANAPYSRSIVSMAFEQGLDFLVLLSGSTLALLVLGPERLSAILPGADRSTQIVVAAILFVIAVALALVGRGRISRAVSRIVDSFRTLATTVDRKQVALLTLLLWIAHVSVVPLLLWGLHLPLTFTNVLALASIPLLIGQIVPLPGGIGAREAAIVALSGATGVSATELLGLAVLQRVLLVLALPLSLGILRLARAWSGGNA
ncbi:MAG TPA: lysylphosphatidylglycerol synthase transmembrane domain-containing protein [Thermomicrobiales bacterium]|nr:lysylphosphatidylglycerol synthase transmembrane domain-containing protein [Thermomicrobiales bacterium]